MEVDDFAPRLAFFFNCHNDLLTEVAKFRAARRLWARIMRDRFGARDERSLRLRFHTQTAGSSLSAQQPWNNVTRTAIQALAAVLGGTQSLHTNALDEALGLPSEKAAQLALRTQQIIAHETGVANMVDPLAGSWTVEARTDELAAEAEALIARIDGMGGMLPAIEQGWVQAQIAEASFAYQQQVESGERTIVGVNAHTEGDAPEAEPLTIDASVAEAQVQALEQLRASRGDVTAPLEKLGAAADGDNNLLPHILACVEAEATLGEICDTLRAVWGEYRPTT
jgi:methylmalonyl-CoA mutase N-terminal domain/subunit